MIFFSPSTLGFYSADIHGDAIPVDAVRITARRHEELLKAQAAGAEIVAMPSGPVARPPRVTLESARAEAVRRTKNQARRRILAIAPYWRQLNDASAIALAAYQLGATTSTHVDVDEPLARRSAIEAIRAACDRVEAAVSTMSAEQVATFDPADEMHWSDAA